MDIDIINLDEFELYDYLKSLSEDERWDIIDEVNSKLCMCTEDDLEFLRNFSRALNRLNSDLMYRDRFYFELYYLVDKEGELTSLGQYYELIYTHHYLKAFKKYMEFSDSLRERNEVFKKNDKALEYLMRFKSNIKNGVR